MEKTIITVVGKDCVGIIAKVCNYLADHEVNILDISQTIVDEYFNMMMIADFSNVNQDFETCQDELKALGQEMGLEIRCQKEEIFHMMHRI